MILALAILSILYIIMTYLPSFYGSLPLESGVATTAVMGFVLLTSFFFSKIAARFHLPLLTGYLLAGIVFGPYGMELFQAGHVEKLKFVDSLALSFIALAVGGELEMHSLYGRMRTILSTTIIQTIGVFVGVVSVFYLLFTLSVFSLGLTGSEVVYSVLILGVIATANSPATALAIINEARAKGAVTEVTLGVTVFKDIFVITLFALIISWIQSSIGEGGALPPDALFLAMFLEVAISILVGVGIGIFVIIYLNTLQGELLVFTLGVAVISTELSSIYELNELLVCITIGFVTRNFSKNGGRFIDAIERSSLPIFVVFFSMAGASLNLHAVRQMWMVALAYFLVRLFFTWITTGIAVRLANETEKVRKYLWGGFISQAGVSLGLAMIVKNQFPEWGSAVVTLIIASVAINQLVGPIVFKLSLAASGEAGKGG